MRSLQTIVRKHHTAVLGVEQRIYPRYEAPDSTRGHIRSPSGDYSCPAKVNNLSLGGAALIVAEPFRSGELIQIEFTRMDPDYCCTLLLRVIHCTETSGAEFVVGGQF